MKASLLIERIGDGFAWRLERAQAIAMGDAVAPGLGRSLVGRNHRAVWCAEIVGRDARYGLAREFLRPRVDYAHSNSAGTRGVHQHYLLESGKVYEVRGWRSWRSEDRYFCRVNPDTGDIERITRSEVDQWLNRNGAQGSASAS